MENNVKDMLWSISRVTSVTWLKITKKKLSKEYNRDDAEYLENAINIRIYEIMEKKSFNP